MIVAFDLDGTLADITHRLHLIKGKDKHWPSFFKSCVSDAPVDRIIRVAEAMNNEGHTVEIWSGRSDMVLGETKDWLAKHNIGYRTLRMRKDGDYRQDCIVKGEWYDALPPHERPVLAFDDRQQVVDMWRSRGVLCCQVAPGDF
jgi:hypothetical protein